MKTFIGYGKTGQFRQVVKNITSQVQFKGLDEEGNVIYDHNIRLPIVQFRGTVKVHGTNASIVNRDGEFTYQSKNNELSRSKDNVGFCNAMMDLEHQFETITELFSPLESNSTVTIFGEWAGKGVQNGVGISELDKAFYIFAIKVGEGEDAFFVDMVDWKDISNPDKGIYNLWDTSMFPVYDIDIDFESPMGCTSELEELTLEVENACPIASQFNIEGIGEGIVWVSNKAYGVGYHKFKVKGQKHSDTKVKKLVTVDPQVIEDIREFVVLTCTDHRLEKGISWLVENQYEVDITSTGLFVKWATNDIMSEENDTILASGLDRKYLPGSIAKSASLWYRCYIER